MHNLHEPLWPFPRFFEHGLGRLYELQAGLDQLALLFALGGAPRSRYRIGILSMLLGSCSRIDVCIDI